MKNLPPLEDRGPLKIAFLITSMPIGGAETLLVNLMRRMDRHRVRPQVVCLKEKGPLGEQIADEFPVHSELIRHRYDVGILNRLRKIFLEEEIDGVVTVGAGDKMFWGRLAARWAGLPVILSALHSTGWPDGVGRANRLLTGLTDSFIAVANSHGRFLVEFEKFPARKVEIIPNGVDTERFQFSVNARRAMRKEWGWDNDVPVCGVVAALRPEKNLFRFLQAAGWVRKELPNAGFVIVGTGPEEDRLRAEAKRLDLESAVRFLGARHDVPEVLSGFDLFSLTSDNEASPVSILEAMSTELPVVCTDVGSVRESVLEGETGWVVPTGDSIAMSQAWTKMLSDCPTSKAFGKRARQHVVETNSLESMTNGYMKLIESVYQAKATGAAYSSSSLPQLELAPPSPARAASAAS